MTESFKETNPNKMESQESLSNKIQEEREKLSSELQEDSLKFQERPKPPFYSNQMIKNVRGEADEHVNWNELEVQDVPVNDFVMPDGVSSPDDFPHHITWEDAVKVTQQLPQIQEDVNAGKTRDDFSKEDQAAGKENTNGRTRIYDLYYGSNGIKAYQIGDKYDAHSGRHRVYAAKHLGLETIPARVREKDDI